MIISEIARERLDAIGAANDNSHCRFSIGTRQQSVPAIFKYLI